MIFRYNWFLTIAFLTAIFCASINSSLYMAIAFLFLLLGSILTAISTSVNYNFDWQIAGGVKNTVILVSLLLICLVIPQVETDMANFSSPIENLENRTRLT